ncbi:CRISPR-associated helicase/endonuclease Cas3 [Verrucomicrobium sp. 3C]|uniref:CRISPR-associated helicase/endonuclease Cas3 n=1 Tax=Verrucomicrobium sp. 3C TaxID=1134055 RepID=UPI000399FF90|nr:CRISPR-associated helicase/endonuclease Cas3 [Verrucomicrobium sp. 3C]
MDYYAHSGTPGDTSDWQPLREHLMAVATLAAEMAAPLRLEKAAYLAGLLHDLGKYTADFQSRLAGANVRVDHSTAGAALLLGDLAKGCDRNIADLIAYCIAGHHAGLPDRLNETAACLNRRVEEWTAELDPVWASELSVDASGLVPNFIEEHKPQDRQDAAFIFSVMTRMIFSCLVDADFKDTGAFYSALENRQVDRSWPSLQELLPQFIKRFDAYMRGRSNAVAEINRLRSDILAHVRGKAAQKPGLFTLTVPTGGGKTLTSLGFALDHARAHGHTRIIYTIPFTSIVDQTAEIFREILGDDNVLEHHSAIDDEEADPKETSDSRDKLKLAMEDWAAPVVVTTNVQLFESLFAARPSRARKVHNIANSVIILDEAQTIPRQLLKPCIRMLDELALRYGCSVVLCTATQPALDRRELDGGLPLEGRELAPDPHGLAEKLRRVRIVRVGPMDNRALIEAIRAVPQALVIVNSRRHALDLYREAKAAGLAGLVHLSTRQFAAHRRRILAEVRRRLREGEPCRLIATSLVEAGVDVDFPRVWRAEAGLDSIIQAAGRCNREGKNPAEESIVSVFSAPDYPPPAEIRSLVNDMQRMIERHEDLASLDAIEDYFSEVYWRIGERLDGKKILQRFSRFVRFNGRIGADFAFRSAAKDFRMIESGMVPVIVVGDDKSKRVVSELDVEQISSYSLARKLQAYCVQVLPKARDLLICNGHVAFVSPDLRGNQFAVLQTKSLYREDVGLLWEDADYLDMESMVV